MISEHSKENIASMDNAKIFLNLSPLSLEIILIILSLLRVKERERRESKEICLKIR